MRLRLQKQTRLNDLSMITRIENLPADIIGYRYDGEVTATDYETVLFPAVEAAVQQNKELKVLCLLGEEFKGFDLSALKDDAALGFHYFKNWKKIAFVSDKDWLNHVVKAFGFLMPGKVRTFKTADFEEAKNWLAE